MAALRKYVSMAKDLRSPCPVAGVLDLIGDKWTLLVLRDLMVGRSTFKEFVSSPERVATNILSDRLARLVAAGLIERVEEDGNHKTVRYQLTATGESMRPVLEAMRDWGLAHIRGTAAHLQG